MNTTTLSRSTLLAGVEFKKIRVIRTEAGSHKYGKPIGSIIGGNGQHLEHIKMGQGHFKGFETVVGKDGQKYDVGFDKDTGKWVATLHNTWHDVAVADNEHDAYHALNNHVGKKVGKKTPAGPVKQPVKRQVTRESPPARQRSRQATEQTIQDTVRAAQERRSAPKPKPRSRAAAMSKPATEQVPLSTAATRFFSDAQRVAVNSGLQEDLKKLKEQAQAEGWSDQKLATELNKAHKRNHVNTSKEPGYAHAFSSFLRDTRGDVHVEPRKAATPKAEAGKAGDELDDMSVGRDERFRYNKNNVTVSVAKTKPGDKVSRPGYFEDFRHVVSNESVGRTRNLTLRDSAGKETTHRISANEALHVDVAGGLNRGAGQTHKISATKQPYEIISRDPRLRRAKVRYQGNEYTIRHHGGVMAFWDITDDKGRVTKSEGGSSLLMGSEQGRDAERALREGLQNAHATRIARQPKVQTDVQSGRLEKTKPGKIQAGDVVLHPKTGQNVTVGAVINTRQSKKPGMSSLSAGMYDVVDTQGRVIKSMSANDSLHVDKSVGRQSVNHQTTAENFAERQKHLSAVHQERLNTLSRLGELHRAGSLTDEQHRQRIDQLNTIHANEIERIDRSTVNDLRNHGVQPRSLLAHREQIENSAPVSKTEVTDRLKAQAHNSVDFLKRMMQGNSAPRGSQEKLDNAANFRRLANHLSHADEKLAQAIHLATSRYESSEWTEVQTASFIREAIHRANERAMKGKSLSSDETKVITPGGRVGDSSPVGKPGGRQNWVDKTGGLPKYIREVAHAMIRDGHDESSAIQLAVTAIKRWAHGGDGVSPKVQAAAVKALAEWEAKKVGVHTT